jgi:hypothetical protein
MFPHSDWNDIDPDTMCFVGHWCASALSVGGMNGSNPNNNFIGRLDEVKVWNITKDSTYFETADSQAGPYISNVTGVIGSDQITVTFSEGVYTDTGSSGVLVPGDFTFTGGGLSVDSVAHTAGDSRHHRFHTECNFGGRLSGLTGNIQPER